MTYAGWSCKTAAYDTCTAQLQLMQGPVDACSHIAITVVPPVTSALASINVRYHIHTMHTLRSYNNPPLNMFSRSQRHRHQGMRIRSGM